MNKENKFTIDAHDPGNFKTNITMMTMMMKMVVTVTTIMMVSLSISMGHIKRMGSMSRLKEKLQCHTSK